MDAPGAVAGVTTALAALGVDVAAVDVLEVNGRSVVDEMLLRLPAGTSAPEVEDALRLAGAVDVLSTAPGRPSSDAAVRAFELAQLDTSRCRRRHQSATEVPHREGMTTAGARAHLLIQADCGTSAALRDYVADVPGVVDAACTSGPFDAVAHVSVSDEHELQRVLAAARRAPGLSRLCLCRRPES